MNKLGHLMITHQVAGNLPAHYRFFLKLGCILPDLLYHTYLQGHTWTKDCVQIRHRMRKLEHTGHSGCLSYLRLGYILHFVEDYFTYPHNPVFQSGLKSHIHYERNLTSYLKTHIHLPVSTPAVPFPVSNSSEQLIQSIQELHRLYLWHWPGFENDQNYMLQAVQQVFRYYAYRFIQIDAPHSMPAQAFPMYMPHSQD